MTTINDLLISSLNNYVGQNNIRPGESGETNVTEFSDLIQEKLNLIRDRHGINLSLHAAKRLRERNVKLGPEDFVALKQAMEKLRSKGGSDSLVITDKAAYIVDVHNNTIVTALDKKNMKENVFTNIDSTLIM